MSELLPKTLDAGTAVEFRFGESLLLLDPGELFLLTASGFESSRAGSCLVLVSTLDLMLKMSELKVISISDRPRPDMLDILMEFSSL